MESIETIRFADRQIGAIAAELPGASAIFRRHKLDFCCGGGVSLADAAAKCAVPLAEIEDSLRSLVAGPADLPGTTGGLIAHIVTRYHETHRRELPELITLARRVERVHADRPEVPAGLADLLTEMEHELGAHMAKEEGVLFPMLRAGGNPMIGMPISVMRAEHDAHGAQLRELARLTGDHVPPDGACNSWRALYTGTRKLEADLMEHIHLENNVLFARFGA